MDKISLEILNMNCSSCAVSVQMVTEKLDGVYSAMIELEGKRGTWEVDLTKVSVQEIISEIEKLGYKAKQVSINN